MSLVHSTELTTVIQNSKRGAQESGHRLTTAHLLLCLFLNENQANQFLMEHDVSAESLLSALDRKPTEADSAWSRAFRRAEDVAQVSRADHLTSLHVLVALCSFVDCAAYRLMDQLQVDISRVRNRALSYVSRNHGRSAVVEEREHIAPTDQLADLYDESDYDLEDDEPHETRESHRNDGSRASSNPRQSNSPSQSGPREVSLAKRLQERKQQNAPASSSPPASNMRSLPLPPSARRGTKPTRGRARSSQHQRKFQKQLIESVTLSTRDFPVLSKFGRNLSLLAAEGNLDHSIGRDAEIRQLRDILNKRRSNNPLLVGEPGVGKTAVVEGFVAQMIAQARLDPDNASDVRVVVELNAYSLLSGTSLRGAFAERMNQLKKEVARAKDHVVVFLDELHHWIGAGSSGDSGADAAGDLKTALARGEFPCIGATTFEEYRKFVEVDQAFSRRFQLIRIREPSADAAIEILQGIAPKYAQYHEVEYSDDALKAAVRLTHRFMPERRLPDKAISILDLAGSQARRSSDRLVTRDLIARLVGEVAGVDPERIIQAEGERILNLDTLLKTAIVGHEENIVNIADVLRRNYAGFVSNRPMGSFLFLGPTGVGKTELAQGLAQVLFHDRQAVVRVDMSEYGEKHSVARLIGAPPGYVGHEAPGMLTEPVRRKPYQLVLFDEVEKAHPDVLNILIQVLDEGRLTDSHNRTVDFTNTVVVLTSNLGAEHLVESTQSRSVGFASGAADENKMSARALREARRYFRPELWNRIDEPLVFHPLTRENVRHIAHRLLLSSSARLERERDISYRCDDSVIEFLIENGGYDQSLGARPMRRTIERHVENLIAASILRRDLAEGDQARVFVEGDELRLARLTSSIELDESKVESAGNELADEATSDDNDVAPDDERKIGAPNEIVI